MAAALCFEPQINDGNVKPMITKTMPVDFGGYKTDLPDSKPKCSSMAGLELTCGDDFTRDGRQQHEGSTQTRQRSDAQSNFGLSKVKNILGNLITLIVGVLILEMVITLSFRSLDALFLVISTLTAGTSVYVIDGINR